MSHTRLAPQFSITSERLDELKEVVPEAFADGKINWETLRECLSGQLEPDDANAEHFGLFWPGKRNARRLAAIPSRGTLLPTPGAGMSEEVTKNLFIEGDNLEVLKLMQKAYAGLVNMIYIDPPYNTGNDLVYQDDFSDPLAEYLRRTGQADEHGALTTNTRADGRFHSNWLSMMYPRLRLARNLLAEDGILFVSIDDNEVHHLRQLLGEIFGEECFIATIIWQKMDSPSRNDPDRTVSAYHDYIHVFARSPAEAALRKKPKPELGEGYTVKLPDGRLARRRQLRKNGKSARRQDRPTMWFPLQAPDGSKVWPIAPEGWEGRWSLSEATWKEREAQGLTEWIKRDYGWVPYALEILPDELGVPWPTIWTEVDQNRQAKARFTELMGSGIEFDNPKPVNLLVEMLRMSAATDGIFLDFFAGSGSFGHAVLEQNCEDGGTRSFICVQLPEQLRQKQFATVTELAEERLRRAIKKLKKEAKPKKNQDLGFRVLKLAPSHFEAWQEYDGGDVEQLQMAFDNSETPLVKGWKTENVLTEVILLEGFPLDSAVVQLGETRDNTIHSITSEHCGHRLLVCLDKQLSDASIKGIHFLDNDVFVCLDSALNDQAKQRLADRCNLKTL